MGGLINSITLGVASVFGNHIWLATMVISMLPLTEVKVAIPFAMDRGYSFWKALFFAMIGSAIITVLLTFLAALILKLLKKTKAFKKIAISIEKRVKDKSNKIENDVESKTTDEKDKKKKAIKKFWLKYLAVVAFVAIPLPLTGVWTGTCIGVFIGLKNYQTISSVLIGNFIASTLVSLLSKLIGHELLFAIMLGFVFAIIIYFVIRIIVKAVKNKKLNKDQINGEEKTESND